MKNTYTDEIIIKIVICGSGWLALIIAYFTSKNNEKKELQKELMGNLDKLIELSKENATDQDYYLVKDRIIFLMAIYKLNTKKQLEISDALDNLLYNLRNKEPFRDTKLKLIQLVNTL